MDSLRGDLLLTALEVQARHALIDALVLVPDVGIRLDGTGEDPEVGHLAHKRVGGRLPDVRRERSGVGRRQGFFAAFALGEAEAARVHFFQALQVARQIDDIEMILLSLAGFATLFASLGDTEQAVELGTLVIRHKFSWNETKAQMAALLQSVTSLTPDRFAAAQERGRTLELDTALTHFNFKQ